METYDAAAEDARRNAYAAEEYSRLTGGEEGAQALPPSERPDPKDSATVRIPPQ